MNSDCAGGRGRSFGGGGGGRNGVGRVGLMGRGSLGRMVE